MTESGDKSGRRVGKRTACQKGCCEFLSFYLYIPAYIVSQFDSEIKNVKETVCFMTIYSLHKRYYIITRNVIYALPLLFNYTCYNLIVSI